MCRWGGRLPRMTFPREPGSDRRRLTTPLFGPPNSLQTQKTPCSGPGFPCSGFRELEDTACLSRTNSSAWMRRHRWRAPDSEEIPGTFPVHQGIRCRDEFAQGCAHRHWVCASRAPLLMSRNSPRSSRDSAGSWWRGLHASEPETGTSGHGSRRRPRASLLASWTVRVR